jgi:DNA repair exonuclease SbcCD ATPase subunit
MGNPFLCASIPALSALTPRPGSNALTFQQKMSQTGMVCRQRYGPVASKAAERTKAGMTEFAVIASEVYRQECRSDHRGTDDDFFVKEEKDDSVLMEDNSLLSLSEQRDTPSTVGSSGSERVTPPPKVDRMGHTNRSFQPSSIYDPEETSDLQAADLSTEHADDPLRGARMELFRNQVSGIDNPEGRLARALEDLNRQDVLIQSLKRQMQMTQTTLDDTTRELEDVKSMAKEKQYKATEIRARAVQEKKRLEDLYENEAMQSKKLRDNVSQLQREVATLKTSLRNARNSQSRSPTQDVNNAQMISMRAELVEPKRMPLTLMTPRRATLREKWKS